MIDISNLSKEYNQNVILENCNIHINEPGMYVICGESGCGKSTLINIIGLMEDSFEGNYFIFDQDVNKLKKEEKELLRYNQISYVYQNPKFLENESVKVNIEISLNKKMKNKDIVKELKRFNLNINYKKKVSLLSGGERKRLAILISFLKDTPLILLDEITVGLDEENKKMVMEYLIEKSKTKVILLVTHEENFIKKYVKTIYHIKDKKLIIRTEDKIIYKNQEDKNNKLNDTYIARHVINHIKNKVGRTLVSTLCMVVALVSFGFSTLLTSSLSDSITSSLSKNINDKQILVTKKEESKLVNKSVTIEKEEFKEIKRYYNQFFDYEGVTYLNDLETFFKDGNYLDIKLENRLFFLKGFNANTINNFEYVDVSDEQYIYSSIDNLQEDEVIIGLTNNQIYTLCNLLDIEYQNETSLMNYLLEKPLDLIFHFSNEEWTYQIDVNLKMVGYTLTSTPLLFHSDPLWNEYFLEEVLQLVYSYELDVIDQIPWTMKKIHYFKIKDGEEMKFLNEFISNRSMEKYVYGIIKREDKILVYFNKRHDSSFKVSSLDALLDDNLVNYTPCSNNGYNVISSALLKGFTSPTFISNEYKLIEEYIDYNSYSESDLGNFQSTILEYTNENLLSLNILDSSKNNFIEMKTYLNEEQKINGNYPKKYNEIIVSKGLLDSLNIPTNSGVFSEKTIYLLMLKNVSYANGKYKNNYAIENVNICGVIDSEEKFIYVPRFWSIIFLTIVLENESSLYSIDSAIFDYQGEDINNYIETLNARFPKYRFENPLLDYKKKVDETIYYLNLGLNIFSFFCLTSSLLMVFISSYLFVMDTKKEVGIYTFYGYKRKSIEKQFKSFSRFLSGYAGILSSIILVFMMFLLNEGLIGIKIPYTLESSFSLVLINVISLIIGDISSFLSTRKILKESPLKQLQEN